MPYADKERGRAYVRKYLKERYRTDVDYRQKQRQKSKKRYREMRDSWLLSGSSMDFGDSSPLTPSSEVSS